MGSYNYLGFAENNVDFLKTVAEEIKQYGVGVCSTRQELGECACGFTTSVPAITAKTVTHITQHVCSSGRVAFVLS